MRTQRVWAIGPQRVWGTRGMGNGVQGYGVYRQWGTGVWATYAMGHMGNGVQGYGAYGQ